MEILKVMYESNISEIDLFHKYVVLFCIPEMKIKFKKKTTTKKCNC